MQRHDGEPVDQSSAPEGDVLETFAPVLSGVLDAADSLTCRIAVRVELAELPLPALRRRRSLLHEELRRTQHWNRLVRARRDLLVAVVCGGPEELHVPVEAASHGGPLEIHLDGGRASSPSAAELPAGLPAGFPVDLPAGPGAHALDPAHGLRGLLLLDRPIRGGGLPEQLQELSRAQQRLSDYADALLAELAVATDVLAERCRTLFGIVAD